MGTELKVIMEMEGVEIVIDSNEMTSLTDLWKAAGSDKSKTPARFLRNAHAVEFIESLAANLKVQICTLTKTRRGGRTSGVWAHWQIGMAFAKWIDPNYHQLVNVGFVRWLEEERDPGLKLDRAAAKFLKQGKSERWIEARLKGGVIRGKFTKTLKDHNCRPVGKMNPYREASNSINLAAIGKTAQEFKSEKGVSLGALTRNHMDERELMRIAFAESEATAMIREDAADGNEQCLASVRKACDGVRAAIQAMYGQRRPPLASA